VTRPTRRSVLAACGAGAAALAGCAGIDVSLGDEGEREYDTAALARIVGEDDPTAPDAFPVRVPDGMIERHYDRGRDLLAGVPERPDLPNGAVARELRERRRRVVEGLEEPSDAPTGLERLEDARRVRGEAAEVDGAYRAAVRDTDRETVAERRTSLRADLHAFEGEWNYRGDDPARAPVVHAELEGFRGTVRRSAEAWPPFPDDPAAVFRAGEVVGDIEVGRAALVDATRIRTRNLEGTTDPRSQRAAITAAGHRLDRRVARRRRRVHGFVDRRAPEAFERPQGDARGVPLPRGAPARPGRGGRGRGRPPDRRPRHRDAPTCDRVDGAPGVRGGRRRGRGRRVRSSGGREPDRGRPGGGHRGPPRGPEDRTRPPERRTDPAGPRHAPGRPLPARECRWRRPDGRSGVREPRVHGAVRRTPPGRGRDSHGRAPNGPVAVRAAHTGSRSRLPVTARTGRRSPVNRYNSPYQSTPSRFPSATPSSAANPKWSSTRGIADRSFSR